MMDRVKSVPVCLAVCKREMRREGRISKVHHQHHRGQGVLPQAGIHSTTIQLEYWSPKLSSNSQGTCQLECPPNHSVEKHSEVLSYVFEFLPVSLFD